MDRRGIIRDVFPTWLLGRLLGERYVGTDGGGIFRSDDGRAHRQPVNEGLTYLGPAARNTHYATRKEAHR